MAQQHHEAARERSDIGARSAMEEMWHEGVMMGLRGSGECKVALDRTRVIVTTTPRPKRLIRELIKDPTTYVTKGNTYDNSGKPPA